MAWARQFGPRFRRILEVARHLPPAVVPGGGGDGPALMGEEEILDALVEEDRVREEEQLSILAGETVAEEDDTNTGGIADAAAARDSVTGGIPAVPPGVPPDGPLVVALPPAAPRPGRERSRSRDAMPEGDATTLVQGVARLSVRVGGDAPGDTPASGGGDVASGETTELRDVGARRAALRGLVVGSLGETDYAETREVVQEAFGMGAHAPHLWLPATWLGELRDDVLRLHPVVVLEVLAAVRSLGDNTLAEIREWCRSVDAGNAVRLAWWDDGPTLEEGAAGTSSSCPSTLMVGPPEEETMGVGVAGTSTPPSTSLPAMPGGVATGTSSPPCSSTSLVVGDRRVDAPEV